jgi:preprotein translocase subunit SecF
MIRYERYMAIAALSSLIFGLTTTAGVYALVGFEVTPVTLIGLLTIMAFSLYDTVIVFDKVQENTQGFEHTTRRTFAEQANLAINQTFMRSINTTLISITPVISLMIIAVWLLGVGTLKDLALVMLVGVICGAYGSIFFATPLLVSMRERTELVRTHTRRVMNRRKGVAAKAADAGQEDEPEAVGAAPSVRTTPAGNKPAPGARPVRPTASRTGRPSGKRNTRQR